MIQGNLGLKLSLKNALSIMKQEEKPRTYTNGNNAVVQKNTWAACLPLPLAVLRKWDILTLTLQMVQLQWSQNRWHKPKDVWYSRMNTRNQTIEETYSNVSIRHPCTSGTTDCLLGQPTVCSGLQQLLKGTYIYNMSYRLKSYVIYFQQPLHELIS